MQHDPLDAASKSRLVRGRCSSGWSRDEVSAVRAFPAGEADTACADVAGLSPEYVTFMTGTMAKGVAYNILRPEAVESIFMLWRITGDETYRRWGADIFDAFEKHSRVRGPGANSDASMLCKPHAHAKPVICASSQQH